MCRRADLVALQWDRRRSFCSSRYQLQAMYNVLTANEQEATALD
jgi:hypothetical protein